jgi:MFS family permease
MGIFERANIRNYYLSYNLFSIGGGLIGVFLNVFFLATVSYVAVLYFQLATWIVTIITYILSGYFMRRYHPKYLYVAGLGLAITLLAAMLVGGGSIASVIVFGLIYGASIGVLYAGNNVIQYDITKGTDRTSFVATNNLLIGISSLIAPIAAGVLIGFSPLPGVYKFLYDFLIAIIFLIVSALFILKIKHKGEFKLKYSIKSTFINAGKVYSRYNWYFALWMIYAVGYSVIVPLYVFQTTGSYLITGIFAGFEVLISIVANFVFRKGFKESGTFAKYAVPALILSSFVLLVPKIIPPPLNAFVFAFLATLFTTPLDNAVNVKYMKFLDKNKKIDRALFWANREYYLVIGRVAILAPMILLVYLLPSGVSFVALLPVLSLYGFVYYTIIGKGRLRLPKL